jgi:hypothetical protein
MWVLQVFKRRRIVGTFSVCKNKTEKMLLFISHFAAVASVHDHKLDMWRVWEKIKPENGVN